MNSRLTMAVLAGLQIALLAMVVSLARHLERPFPLPERPPTSIVAPGGSCQPTQDPIRSVPFHWSQLESPDYRQYRDNLRAVGCPESTVRDILVADVERLYAQRWAESNLVAVGSYWQRGRKQAELERSKRREFVALLEEKRAVLRELLGVMVDGPGLHLWWEDEIAPIFVSCLPEEKAVQTLSMARYYMTRMEEVDRLDQGVSTPGDQEEKERYLALCRQELSQLLSAEELEELELRVTLALYILRNHSVLDARAEDYFSFTGPELRSLIRRLRELANPLQQMVSWLRESTVSEEALETAMKAEIRKLVGESRYRRYERTRDHSFGDVYEFVQENRLPDSVAEKLDDLRQRAEARVGELSGEKGVSVDERMAVLENLQAQVQMEVQAALGAGLYPLYAQNRGSWVTNLANPRRLQ